MLVKIISRKSFAINSFIVLTLIGCLFAATPTAQGATPTWTEIGDQEFTKGKQITAISLPALTNHGDYWSELNPAIDSNGWKGLTYLGGLNQRIYGTPNATGEQSFTWKCWPKGTNGNHDHTMTFKITIFDPPDFGTATIVDQVLLKDNTMTSLSLPTVTASDVAGTPSYSITPTLPTGLSLDSSTGVLSGKPTAVSASAEYTYTVTDKNGVTDTIKFNLEVKDAPTFGSSTISDQKYVLNTAITNLTLPQATGGVGSLSYSLTPSLSTGLSFNAGTRVISGTPTVTKDQTEYTYTVTDSNTPATSVNLKFKITVDAKPTVSFTEPAGTQVAGTFDVTIAFSKAVTNFTASDITVTTTRTSGTGNATVALSGSGKDYTATVTSPSTAKGTITLEIPADAATLVSNSSLTGPASKTTSSAMSFDTTPPTVSFTEPAGTQAAATFDVRVNFSKTVTGFAADDITVTTTHTSGSGDATVVIGSSGSGYTDVTVTSPSAAKGTITLEVAADSVTDGTRTGPASKATSSAMSFDTTPPTVDFTEPTDHRQQPLLTCRLLSLRASQGLLQVTSP